MSIYDDLIALAEPLPVKAVRVGVYQTAVWSRNCGLCTTQSGEPHPYSGLRNNGDLEKKNVRELAEFFRSGNPLEATIGMAALQSTLSTDNLKLTEKNAQEYVLERGENKRLGVIGHFPFADRHRAHFSHVDIFEKRPQPGDLPESAIPEYLPSADVVMITGMTLVNGTFESVMKSVSSKAFVVLMGPSVPLTPVLFNYGVDVVGGTLVTEPESVLLQVSQGASYKDLTEVRMVNLLRNGSNV